MNGLVDGSHLGISKMKDVTFIVCVRPLVITLKTPLPGDVTLCKSSWILPEEDNSMAIEWLFQPLLDLWVLFLYLSWYMIGIVSHPLDLWVCIWKKCTIVFLIKYYLTIGRLVFTLICLIFQTLYVYLPIYFALWVITSNRSQSHKYISKISPWFICAIFRAGVTCLSPILVQNLMIYLYANHERFFINICRIKPLLYCYYYL